MDHDRYLQSQQREGWKQLTQNTKTKPRKEAGEGLKIELSVRHVFTQVRLLQFSSTTKTVKVCTA